MKLRIVAVAGAAALGLVACGSSAGHSGMPGMEGATSITAAGTAANPADVTFAQGMIPHHQQAVAMASLALDAKAGASDKVRALAMRIKDAQDPEVTLMTGWLAAWGKPMQMEGGHDMAGMSGMMSDDEMKSLATMTGTAFDKMWLQMMTRHHQGAIEMAKTVKSSGSNPGVLKLAGQIITGQQAEIDEMAKLLAG